MRIIAIASQKGGVGKTTTCYALGALLARKGRRVVMIDLDEQASLTDSCSAERKAGTADLLMGRAKLEIARQVAPCLWVVTADDRLADVEIHLARMERAPSVAVLKRGIAGGDFDYCLLDLAPSLGLLSVNGLTAAGEVLIPARPEFLGLKAQRLLVDTIRKVKAKYNPTLKIIGILPTFYNPRALHHAEVIQAWKDAGLPVLDIAIRQSVRVAEAPIAGQSIVDYEPGSPIADAYFQLSEVIDHAETR